MSNLEQIHVWVGKSKMAAMQKHNTLDATEP